MPRSPDHHRHRNPPLSATKLRPTDAGPATTGGTRSRCLICGNDIGFDLPEDLVRAGIRRQVVLFAGAGISTESPSAYPQTLYDRLAADLGATGRNLPFSALMTEYETRKGRKRLLEEIKSRLDYAEAFPQVRSLATRFHHEMATIPWLDQIVTTNWDTFFETVAGAIPIVTPEDYAFWDMPGRHVFKIHGSISNLGTLVVTSRDYQRCYRRLVRGVIGSSLQHILVHCLMKTLTV